MKLWMTTVLLALSFTTWAAGGAATRPDAHAPIGVMGDHSHEAGEWMFSYRYMRMEMSGNRAGNNRVSDAAVLGQFMVIPIDMDMDMHMLGAMYAPSDQLTVMIMIPRVELSMNHLTRTGVRFRTETSGIGDIKVSSLYRLQDADGQKTHLNLGISLPTGSTDEKDTTPAGPDSPLPYPMQLGSGTYDLMPGITYRNQRDGWSWGAQAIATIRLGENSDDYTLGDRLELAAWVARELVPSLSGSLRLAGADWGNIDGADPRLNAMMVPTADPDRRGGTRFDVLAGLNWHGRQGLLAGHRLALEWGVPVHQDLDGPQLETDALLTVGWQYTF